MKASTPAIRSLTIVPESTIIAQSPSHGSTTRTVPVALTPTLLQGSPTPIPKVVGPPVRDHDAPPAGPYANPGLMLAPALLLSTTCAAFVVELGQLLTQFPITLIAAFVGNPTLGPA